MAPAAAAAAAAARAHVSAGAPSGDELRQGLLRYLGLRCERPFALPPGFVVRVVEEPAEAEQLLQALARSAPELLGLDTEWGPGASVALLQLASAGECLLLRGAALREPPEALRALLEDAAVLKCGVGLAQDLALLEAQFGLRSRGAVELQALAARCDHLELGLGLAAICRSVLGASLAKDHGVRCSDWTGPLSAEQVDYAACDAYVAVEIARRLHGGHARREPPQSLLDWCGDLVDRRPSRRAQRELQQRQRPSSGPPAASPGGGGSKGSGAGAPLPKVPLRKSQLYGGCRMLAPDGTHLANVGRGKAEWYVSRGLGVRESAEPFVFRLLSAPAGLGHAGDDFYLQEMVNQCVGCGRAEDLVRYSVVPHAFRGQLPAEFKEHSSHDIVLLCLPCFQRASDTAARHRRGLLASIGHRDGAGGPWALDGERQRVRKAARALEIPGLPPRAREEKLGALRAFFGRREGEDPSEAELAEARELAVHRPVDGHVAPEAAYVASLRLAGGEGEGREARAQDFVVSWRRLFLEAVRPERLPVGWDLNRSVLRSR